MGSVISVWHGRDIVNLWKVSIEIERIVIRVNMYVLDFPSTESSWQIEGY